MPRSSSSASRRSSCSSRPRAPASIVPARAARSATARRVPSAASSSWRAASRTLDGRGLVRGGGRQRLAASASAASRSGPARLGCPALDRSSVAWRSASAARRRAVSASPARADSARRRAASSSPGHGRGAQRANSARASASERSASASAAGAPDPVPEPVRRGSVGGRQDPPRPWPVRRRSAVGRGRRRRCPRRREPP